MNDDDRCPATNRDGERCGHPAGWGTDNDSGPCKFHGGASDGAPPGEDNGSYEHGGFSKHLRADLEDEEIEAIDDFVGSVTGGDPEGVVAELAAEAYIRYKRSGDARHLAELRKLLAEFNVIENTDEVSIDGLIADFTGE